MTLKIKPHAVDQDSGTFIFPSVLVTDSIITGSVTVFDESVLMGQADAFNFAGDNVEAVISGTTAHIMVTGTAGGGGGHETGTMVIYDEGDWLGVFEEMRFLGDGVDAYNSGSYVAVSIPSGGASGGTSVTVTTGTFYTEEVLYEIEIGTATGSVVIPAISQEYDHLKLYVEARTDRALVNDGILIYFNGDTTAANYSNAKGGGGSADISSRGDRSDICQIAGGNAPAGMKGTFESIIEWYADTTWQKDAVTKNGYRVDTAEQYAMVTTTQWESTAAITSIQLSTVLGDNFVTGSKFQLVGVKETVLVTSVEGGGLSGGNPVSVTTGTFYVEEVLYDMTLGSATGSFIIPGISQEYDHLKIIASLRTDLSAAAEICWIYFNNDTTAANYRFAQHYAGSAHNDGEGDEPYFIAVPAANAPADEWSSIQSIINDYADTSKHKSINIEAGERQSPTIEYERNHVVWWENTNAISQIEIAADAADFLAGSRLQVIGVKETALVTSVTGGGGHLTGTVVVYEEDTFLGVFEEMRFIGDGVTALNSGSYAAIAITGTAGGGGHETGTMVVYDESDFLGVFEEMRFVGDGVDAYNSGSYVAVSIPSGGGGGGGTGSVSLIQHQFVEGTSDITLGAAAWTDMADMEITGTFEGGLVEIMFSAGAGNTSNQGVTRYRIEIDGAQVGQSTKVRTPVSSVGPSVSLLHTDILSAGPHTIKVQWNSEVGTAQNRAALELEHRQLSVKEFGLVAEVGASGGTPVSVTTGTFYIETLLEEVYLESTTGSIIMPGISQEYDHLKIIGSLRGSESAESTNINILFNGDTTEANYKTARHVGGGAHTSDVGNWPIIGAGPAGTATAGQFASLQVFIPDYTNPTKKGSADGLTGQRSSADTTYAHHHRTSWENDSPINRVDIDPRVTDGFVSGTWVQLFGLREETVVTSVEGGGGHLTGTVVVYDEGDFLGVFEEMRFIGDGVTALNSGSYVAVAITGSAASIDVYDDSVFAVSAEGISFDEGLDVTATGSFAYVKHTPVGVRVRRSTTQTISTSSETAVVFNTEVYDYGDMWNSASGSVLIAPVDGIYDIGLAVQFVQNATGNRQAKIYVNGSTLILAFGQLAENYPWRRTFAVQYALDAGDYVSAAVFQNSGGDLDLAVSNPAYPAFWMALVVPL